MLAFPKLRHQSSLTFRWFTRTVGWLKYGPAAGQRCGSGQQQHGACGHARVRHPGRALRPALDGTAL